MDNAEPKGCLTALLRLLGIRLSGPTTPAEDDLPYRLRDDFLSPAELSFFRVLQLAVKDRATIATKVNLADIFFVSHKGAGQSYRNRIDRKHVDFLVCDPATMTPRCGIELDDASHNRRDRQHRDRFVDDVFRAAGLPLLRVPARSDYDLQTIRSQIAAHLTGGPITAPAATPAPPDRRTPTCPKCQVPMVQRKATRGRNAGTAFWGCSNYPRCRETL